MKAKLMVNDIEIEVDISKKELKKLQKEDKKKKTGYERVGFGHTYSFVNNYGEVITLNHQDSDDNSRYEEANYYSDYTMAENNARADRLMRQLRRFAVEHRSIGLNWDKKDMTKWVIYYNRTTKELETVSSCNAQNFGTIYFDLALHAYDAIEAFHDELIWYFTEYKDSL